MRKLLVTFVAAVLAVSAASAKRYSVTLFQPGKVGGTELKAGEYRLELKDDKARLTNGRQTSEAVVKVENGSHKNSTTSVRYENGRVKEIRLGGTNTVVVFPES